MSLTKLAVEKLEETGRPLRLAIDISIWQFQVQAARGGSNPAIRTLFYRLLRLLSLSIQPVFVFDGPNKPAFKRNKRSGRGDGVATAMAKRLIKLFGFQVHDAPGEAEAECALLQQHGIVDAVLSEDVDTIMFGCTRTLRNWSSEGPKGSKTPTHVSLYDTEELRKNGTGLDREGMVLVALMSGGDYIPEGIPGAGVKLACEAARAGFGKSLCSLKKSDTSELASWKESLTYELRHNESGFFRTRHKALSVPESFPNLDVLRYYTHPVVSPTSVLDRLRDQSWDRAVDVRGLREFVRETFDWTYRVGAVKFIRVLAPCLLVRKMMTRNFQAGHGTSPVGDFEKEESELVMLITSRRAHFSTDATPELRISFIPTKIVGYDFQEEPDEVIDYGRDGLALNSDDDFETLAEVEGSEATAKSGSKKPFIPTESDLVWIPETVAKLGIPITVKDWEEAQHAKAARQKTKAQKSKGKIGGANTSSLDKFVKVTKNIPRGKDAGTAPLHPSLPVPSRSPLDNAELSSQDLSRVPPSDQAPQKARPTRPRSSKQSKSKSTTRNASPASRPDANTKNPWTIAGSQKNVRAAGAKSAKASETITISSSPPASPDQDRYPSMSQPDGSAIQTNSPPSSPLKRRSVTPTRTPRESYEALHRRAVARAHSPSPKSSEKKPQRKLARTASLPVKQSPLKSSTERSSARHLARAQTVAVEAPLSDLDDDSELDLPPLSIVDNLPKESPAGSFTASQTAEALKPQWRGQEIKKAKKQATLPSAFSTTKRTTKVYMPRKSEPGFFREVEVEVDKADELLTNAKAHVATAVPRDISRKGAAAWRRSDISCIDLTGED
ncbi:Serine--tRNA ligase, mitochondrial [Hypoxylon texense]